jgi:LPXTG-motif cell wall-anchored protein
VATGSLAFTGFDVNDAVPFGIALMMLGGLLLLRRRPRQDSSLS